MKMRGQEVSLMLSSPIMPQHLKLWTLLVVRLMEELLDLIFHNPREVVVAAVVVVVDLVTVAAEVVVVDSVEAEDLVETVVEAVAVASEEEAEVETEEEAEDSETVEEAEAEVHHLSKEHEQCCEDLSVGTAHTDD